MVSVSDLHPAQISVGQGAVHQLADQLAKKKSSGELSAYLAQHVTALAIGPDGAFYMTDHAYLSLALAEVEGKSVRMPAHIIRDWTKTPATAFWQQMTQAGYAYLYNEDGQGPRPATDLPRDIFSMKDDPFRSLAWSVQAAGGFNSSPQLQADFAWADYFRTRLNRADVSTHLDRVLPDAIKLASDPAAAHLPGYRAAH